MGFIRTVKNGFGFEDASTGKRFVPVGSNYSAIQGGYRVGEKEVGCFHLFGQDDDMTADGLDTARHAMDRLAELGLNVIRIWLEPDEFFPTGLCLDARGAAKLDALIGFCRERGIFLSLGMHLSPTPTGWKLHNFQPPHNERLLEMLNIMAQRWGQEEQVLSWTIVGEGQLPWYTAWLGRQWPEYLRYWYNDDLDAIKKSWAGLCGLDFRCFEDVPVPPRNIGACLGLDRVNPGRLKDLPHDPWAGSMWRYDWRMFLEEVGSRRVHQEVRALRGGGARQMTTVGANSWIFPNLPAGQMTMGYNPYFHLDSVDYLCQHNYPGPQCLPGGNGDPLDNEESMAHWMAAMEVMGRIYSSMGKPVIMEEFGWYGGGKSGFLCPLPFRSEEDQARYNDRFMEATSRCFSGWMQWQWRDMPNSGDITNLSGLYAADGKRLKPWGRRYAEWAAQLKKTPPQVVPANATMDMPMRDLLTSDVAHETWLQQMIAEHRKRGPLDFRPVFEPRHMTTTVRDLRGKSVRRPEQNPGDTLWAKG